MICFRDHHWGTAKKKYLALWPILWKWPFFWFFWKNRRKNCTLMQSFLRHFCKFSVFFNSAYGCPSVKIFVTKGSHNFLQICLTNFEGETSNLWNTVKKRQKIQEKDFLNITQTAQNLNILISQQLQGNL